MGDPLPGVFLSICKESIGRVKFVAATVLALSERDIWVDSHIKTKYFTALVLEVCLINKLRTLLVKFRCNLEPAELSAVLPSPLSATVSSVNGSVLDFRSSCGVIIPRVIALVVLSVNNRSEQILLV